MKIVDVKSVPSAPNPHGVDARKIYDKEYAQVIVLTLKPEERLRKHITPVDVFFYVIEGKGIVEIGDEKEEVHADMLVESPANIPHCWYNESNEILRIVVVKMPRPKEATRLL